MGMLYEYDEVEPFNERERRALASEGRQGMTVEEELATYNRGVRAALKWAAGQVEAAGCICVGLNGAQEYDREFSGPPGFTFEGKLDFHLDNPVVEHDPRCPDSLAAKIRKGAS